ncbi:MULTISPECIES: hypothetical protein [Enterobacterales]|uniref:hypothetical protein n=1 Tax=Enterobacterales TaxID=91347 RepID=UPI002ED813E6
MRNTSQLTAAPLVDVTATGAHLFALRDNAANAIGSAKEAREVIALWLDTCGPHSEREAIRLGLLLSSVSEVISQLERVIAED